jgi:hypothetical protein
LGARGLDSGLAACHIRGWTASSLGVGGRVSTGSATGASLLMGEPGVRSGSIRLRCG